jgi:hypothetical protein
MTDEFHNSVMGVTERSYDALRGLRGQRLNRVRYVVLPESPGPEMRASESWDEVEYAVELVFDGMSVVISWQMENEIECLTVRPRGVVPVIPDYSKTIDLSAQSGWEACVGEELISVRASQHRPDPAQGDCLWALALTFRNAASVAVALGELVDDIPSYLPDSLVVLFGKEAAEGYWISGSPTSAWGAEIA